MPNEFPRHYTPTEIESIARTLGRDKLSPLAVGMLQEAVEGYQWSALSEDWDRLGDGPPRSTHKRRRTQLQNIIALCDLDDTDKLDTALNKLDGFTSQLLGTTERESTKDVKRAAERAVRSIKTKGPDPKRARRQFICDLLHIFAAETGKHPGRSVRVGDYGLRGAQEYGRTLDFVKAALEPFGGTRGCEADLKACLHDLKVG